MLAVFPLSWLDGSIPQSPRAVVELPRLGTLTLREDGRSANVSWGPALGDGMQSTVPFSLIEEIVPVKRIVAKPERFSKTSGALKTLILVKSEETASHIRTLFKSDPRFHVVSDCVSELELVPVLERTDLDVTVIDLNLPQLGSKPFFAAMNRMGRLLFLLDADPRLERLLQNKRLPYLVRNCEPGQFHEVAAKLILSDSARSRANAQTMVRLLSGRYRARSSRLAVRLAKRLRVFDQDEIYAVEADGKTTWIHLGLESHQVGEPLSQLAGRLDSDRLFRISRRVLVNLMHIKEISVEPLEGCCVWLHNDRMYRMPPRNALRMRRVLEALCKS
jgi:DNA-binding LytR/AlgR family response regulator